MNHPRHSIAVGACVAVPLLLALAAQPTRGMIPSGPREIRLRWQYLTAPPAPGDRRHSLTLILPDRSIIHATDVHVEDITGNIPGSTLYYDQFATSQFRLDVVGPAELIDALRGNAGPNVRAEMHAQYYRAVGRLRIVDFKVRGTED
jgi:hypothetical protein